MFSIAAALADPIPGPDPVIRSGGGSGSVPITSSTFTIGTASGSSPTDGTPCLLLVGGNSTPAPGCFFLNQIGTSADTIRVMVFIADQNFSGVLTCALTTALGGPSPWFTQCGASGDKVTFFGGPGIPFGADFSLGFRGFNDNATFSVEAFNTNIPEPGTLVLLGGAALLVRRRLRVA
jgi:hypothetical protein